MGYFFHPRAVALRAWAHTSAAGSRCALDRPRRAAITSALTGRAKRRRDAHEQRTGVQQGSSGADVGRVERILVIIKLFGWEEIDRISGPDQGRREMTRSRRTCRGRHRGRPPGAMSRTEHTAGLEWGTRAPTSRRLSRACTRSPAAESGLDPGQIDGIFGPKTQAAVRAYQTDQGVASDGTVVDRTSWSRPVPRAKLASLSGLTTV